MCGDFAYMYIKLPVFKDSFGIVLWMCLDYGGGEKTPKVTC